MASENNRGRLLTPREGVISPKTKRKRARALARSHSQHDIRKNPNSPPSDLSELSVDYRAPGLLKIFGESVVFGARYKSVLVSTRSTAQELIKQALERYGLPARLYRDFVLCESVGRATESTDSISEGENIKGKVSKSHSVERNKKNGSSLPSSPRLASSSLSLSPSTNDCASPRTPRGVRSLALKFKARKDKSPLGTPRASCDSPRTPLGSPRTPCGSPSTSRGSPRASVYNHIKSENREQDITNCVSSKVQNTDAIDRISRHFPSGICSEHDSPRITVNILKTKDNKRGYCDPNIENSDNDSRKENIGNSDWTEVSVRVLALTDRPLELQDFWKPPEGLSRRFELRRRCDLISNAMDDDTLGLNDNARKIMMSKVSPGVIPHVEFNKESVHQRSTLREEWDKASMVTNATLSYNSPRDQILTNVVEGDSRQAYVCPSIYPYLLTLRGCSIQKDLVLYPLKSRALSIGSSDKKSQTVNIRLCSDDVSPMHCRVALKRLPQDGESGSHEQRQYWYCLEMDIYENSYVTINGVQALQKATVYPGDLLGIGRQYLFLYKDPTGGHDIPSAVPWLPDREVNTALHSQAGHIHEPDDVRFNERRMTSHQNNECQDITSTDYFELDEMNDSALRNAAIFLAYHRDKEIEVMEAIAEVNCWSPNDHPHSLVVLFLAAHHYSARKFSGDHQSTFFKRIVRVIRGRVGVLSKAMSQQKHESPIFSQAPHKQAQAREIDHFPCVVTWLSNIMALLGHFRTSHFQSYVSDIARRSDVTTVLQEAVNCLEETVNFLFQQTVYSVTKVLYGPLNKVMHQASTEAGTTTNDPMDRIVHILHTTHTLAKDLMLNEEVTNQLMVYLLFFISTTLFNRVIAKGTKLYNRDSGVRLQDNVSALEKWALKEGLEAGFVRVSEHIMSLTDLLASSKRSLIRLDWASFQKQFSPLTDAQLCKVLSEYNLGEGSEIPRAWYPSYQVDTDQDLTVSLSSHPPFDIPKQEAEISLSDTFPASFFRHFEQVQQRFSLVGEDVYYSGVSSAGNTPRLSESINRSENVNTFFSQDSLSDPASRQQGYSLLGRRPDGDGTSGQLQAPVNPESSSNGLRSQLPKPPPPPTAPKPSINHVNSVKSGHHSPSITHNRGQGTEIHMPVSQIKHSSNQAHGEDSNHHPSAPPPYNMAMKNRKWPNQRLEQNQPHAVVLQHHLPDDPSGQRSKPFQQNMFKVPTLPNFHDKSSKSNSHSNKNKPQPILRTQHSWAYDSNIGLFHRHETTQNGDLSSSYPFVRPRPSSASDLEQQMELMEKNESFSSQFMSSSQREEFLRNRSSSALGNKSRHSPHHTDFRNQNHLQQNRGVTNKNPHLHNRNFSPQNYEHVKDSSHTQERDLRQPKQNYTHNNAEGTNHRVQPNSSAHKASNLKRSPRNNNMSVRSTSQVNISAACSANEITRPGVLDESSMPKHDDKSQHASLNSDIPPPLPPKGELLRRRTSVESQKSENSRSKQDSDPHSSTSSSNFPRSGSRTSVEIQDITENQYILYNPNLPVNAIFDHNQNTFKMENKNARKGSNPNSPAAQRKLLKVPPLDLPDDLLGTSEAESADEVFSGVSDRRFDSSDNSFRSPVTLKPCSKKSKDSGRTLTFEDITHPLSEIDLQQYALRPGTRSSTGSDKYPDDIYIDVQDFDTDPSGSNSSLLKVLPLDESNKTTGYDSDPGTVCVRYRHTMPEPRDIATNGEITGEVFTIALNKAGSKLGMGLIDGLHTSLKLPGIYVRNVLPDTPAALCGCIRVGDRILAVNGKSIVGADYQSAMKLIRTTGPKLQLLVAKCDRSVASKISASSA